MYHYDLRGSTTAITNMQNTVTDRYTYGSYGELLSHTGTSTTPFLYNGRDGVMTDSNGLNYMRARYYSPTLKRFINADTLKGSIKDGETLNNYAYANGNPISMVDPFGRCADSTDNGTNSTVNISLDVSTGTVVYDGNKISLPTELYDIDRDNSLANSSKVVLANLTLNWYNASTQDEKDYILAQIEAVRNYISEHKVSEWTESFLANCINQNIGGLVGILTDKATGLTDVEELNKQIYYTKGAYMMCSVVNATSDALKMGNKVHYDQLNGGDGEWLPSQLRDMYSETTFKFTKRGEKGADVEYLDGVHPSEYENNPMKWPEGFNYGDFKPGTGSGYKTFLKDINKGKLPFDTTYLPYDPESGKLQYEPEVIP
jgi:RHS repeat-associated protein